MELARLPPPVLVTYGFLLLAIVGLWVRPVVWMAALLGAVGCGYWSGVLTWPAVVWTALLTGACWLYRTGQGAPANSRLGRALVGFGGGQLLAVGGSAALWLAHWAGGWSYVLLAALAGLGYTLAIRLRVEIPLEMR